MADMVDQAVPEVPMDGTGGEIEPSFHEYTGDDGTVTKFKDGDELNKYIKDNAWTSRDYTQKSQRNAAEHKQRMTALEAEYKKRNDDLTSRNQRYDTWDQMLKTRPNIAKQLERMAGQPASANEIAQRGQSYTDQRYQELADRLDARDAQDREAALNTEREGIYDRLGQKYPGFDKEKVSAAVAQLDGDNLEPLIEMIWKASSYDPVGMQENIEADMQAKQGARMMRSGGAPSPNRKSAPKDLKSAREQAMRDAGIM